MGYQPVPLRKHIKHVYKHHVKNNISFFLLALKVLGTGYVSQHRKMAPDSADSSDARY